MRHFTPYTDDEDHPVGARFPRPLSRSSRPLWSESLILKSTILNLGLSSKDIFFKVMTLVRKTIAGKMG